MALFGNLQPRTSEKSGSSPASKSTGIFGGLAPRAAGVAAPTPAPDDPRYFAAVDERGNSYGFSDNEKDTSGRPFFAFRKPGDTATTTDRTRVATTFDPRKPMAIDRDAFYNPRAVADVAAMKKAMGGAWNDELDHKIALALSGSNAPENLRSIPADDNDDSPLIMDLQKKVISGEMSLFDAQVRLAKKKGIDVPFTGSQKKGFINKIIEGARKIFNTGKDALSVQEAEAATISPTPSGSFLGGLTPKQPVQPQFEVRPSILGGADMRNAESSPVATDRGTAGDLKAAGKGFLAFLNPKNTGVDNPVNIVDVAKEIPGSFSKVVGEPQLRAYGAVGSYLASKMGLSDKPYRPESEFEKSLFGTDQDITLASVGRETRGGEKEIPYLDPALGFFVGSIDAFDGGTLGKVLKISRPAREIIAGSKDAEEIVRVLKTEVPGISDPLARAMAQPLVFIKDANEVDSVLNRTRFELQELAKKKPAAGSEPLALTGGLTSRESFKGFKDITTNVLNKLEGKSSVSRQFISDLTNMPELRQAEKDIVRNVLNDYPEGADIPVKEFAEKVRSELLPLTAEPGPKMGEKSRGVYESVALPAESRGPVENYSERIYQSPIKTSAGGVHFNEEDAPNYFAHSRIEDTPGNTRRVIELQSDLFQKGRLEGEIDDVLGKELDEAGRGTSAERIEALEANRESIQKEMRLKLEPYRNTWWERVIREEIKQAGKDGKKLLQIPTGETAMKIEGLGTGGDRWILTGAGPQGYGRTLEVADLKPCATIHQDGVNKWIITEVLGEGKFKAVQKKHIEMARRDMPGVNENYRHKITDEAVIKHMQEGMPSWIEEFDISGKVDTENPIYRFYEKQVGRYLQRFGAQKITDKQGVSWWQFDVPKGAGEKPVQAFKRDIGDFKPNISKEEAEKALYQIFDKDEVRLIFDEDLLKEEGAYGLFRQGASPYSSRFSAMIKLLEDGGKVDDSVLYHEAFHAYFRKFLTDAERKVMLTRVKNNILTARHKFYPDEHYKTIEAKAEEWLADDFADYVKAKSGGAEYKGFFRRQWERVLTALRALIRKKERFDKLYESILNKKRTPGEVVEGTSKKAPADGERYSDIEKANSERNKVLKKEEEADLPDTKIEKEVLAKEKSLANEYRAAGKIKGMEEFHRADEVLSDIHTEMMESRPGERVFTGYGSDAKVEGVSSTFPKWIPEHLRSMDLFESVAPSLDLQSLKFPKGSRQLELMNVVLKEADKRLGIDTSAARAEITKKIEGLSAAKLAEKDERSAAILLNKSARKTEADIAKRDHLERIRKADEESSRRMAEELKYEAAARERIRQAKLKGPKKDNFLRAVMRAIKPVQNLDADTRALIEKWFEKKLVAKDLAEDAFRNAVNKGPQNMQEIIAYESGKPTRYIKEAMDDLGTEAQRRGLDFQWKDNYLSHVYSQDRKTQMEAITRYLKDQGMTEEDMAGYISGEELPKEKSLRLKMTPFFARARTFPTYSVAMKYGLTPKYTRPAQLIAHYRKEMEETLANRELLESLKNEAKILTEDQAPDHWIALNRQFSKETYYAPKPLADLINGKFRDEDNLSVHEKIPKTISRISRFMQELTLSAGVPYTNINYFSIGQAIKLLTTAVGETAKGDLKGALSSLKASFAFIRANSNAASAKWFYDNRQYVARMAAEGLDISGRVGSYDRQPGELYKRWTEMLNEVKVEKGIGKGKTLAEGLKELTGMAFNKAFNEKTFSSMLAQVHTQIFKDAYNNAAKSGMTDKDAAKFAAKLVSNINGIGRDTGRSKLAEDWMGSLLFAPKFREGLINTFLHSAEAFGPKNLRNPAYAKNRAFIMGAVITYAIYNFLNRQLNDGQNMWENPPGREFALRYEKEDGTTMYLEFLPSVFAFPRNMAQGAIATAKGDFDLAKQKFGTAFSMPIKLATEISANKDYFGREIYKEADETDTKIKKIAQYVGLGVNHPFVREAWRYSRGDEPLWQAASIAFEMPFKYSSVEKEQRSEFFLAMEKQTKERAKAKAKVRPTYDKNQELKAAGRVDEANEIYNNLSPEDRELYDQIKSDEKRKLTNSRKPAMSALYDDLQELKEEGRGEEANRIYWGLSDDDRKIYDSIRKSRE